MAVGDPHERPDVETVFVPNSFDLNRDARDWEACTLVPWAMHLPRDAGARDIAELLADKLNLDSKDLSVTLHQPEPYLIRFESPKLAAAAMASNNGRFRGRGIDICLRRWRSLTHTLGFRFFYKVKLCLDGIPDHAWTPGIVERVIGHRCALQTIITDLVQPEDSRHIELWAWSANPSEIPKRVWLAFTNRPSEHSSAVYIGTEPPPEPWHQGDDTRSSSTCRCSRITRRRHATSKRHRQPFEHHANPPTLRLEIRLGGWSATDGALALPGAPPSSSEGPRHWSGATWGAPLPTGRPRLPPRAVRTAPGA
jgi:hypothetical protein